MAARTLHRWVFSWLCRWFPGRLRGRRRPIFRKVHPFLEKLEDRWSPVSINVLPSVGMASSPLLGMNSDLAGATGETRKTEVSLGELPASENLTLLFTPRRGDDGSLLVRMPPQAQQTTPTSVSSQPDTTALDTLFTQLSSRPLSILSSPPKPLVPPASAGGGGGGAGGKSTPNAGMGGGGPTGGGGGPGLVNANQFTGVKGL